MTDHEPQDPELTAMIRERFRPPPPTPRDAIWARIQASRTGRPALVGGAAPRRLRPTKVIGWITGIAAILALGIGIGQMQRPDGAGDLGDGNPQARQVALSNATVQHLSQVETFLTAFRTGQETEFTSLARDLLSTTRLLLDSHAAADRGTEQLLQDLEFVLAQIIQAPADRSADRELITDGLNQREVLPRLRTAIPAGSSLRLLGEL